MAMLNLNHYREVLMGYPNILEEILGKLDDMPLEDQDLLVELIKNRYREKRREDIRANARQTLEEYKKGLTSKGNVSDLFRELEA
jgi:hypothetical protein